MLPFPNAHRWVMVFLFFTFAAFLPRYFAVLSTAPWLHHLHGITATAWIVLVATQSWTAHRRKWNAHVWSGIASMALVPLFTLGGLLVTQRTVQSEGLFRELFGQALSVADIALSFAFLALYTMALRHRRTPDLHARYMVATLIVVSGPAISRFFANYVPGFLVRSAETLPRFGAAIDASFIIAAAFCLFLIFKDRMKRKPIAPFVGALAGNVALIVSYYTVGRSDWYAGVANWIADLPMWQVAVFALSTSTAAVAWGWRNPIKGSTARNTADTRLEVAT